MCIPDHRQQLAAIAAGLLALLCIGCTAGSSSDRTQAPNSAPAALQSRGGSNAKAEANTDGEDWAKVIEAGKREGKLLLRGQTGADVQESLTGDFRKKYPEIQVEYIGGPGSAVFPRLSTERAAGQFLTDVVVTGTTTELELIKNGVLDPLSSYVVGPESREQSKWREGRFEYADKERRYNLVFSGGVKVPFAYNRNLASPAEFASYWDLVNPKWKGKLAMGDPRAAGAGQGGVTYAYTVPSLGKEFLTPLLTKMDIAFSRDDRQVVDWIGQGKYVIDYAHSDSFAKELADKGVPVAGMPAESLKEGSFLNAAWGTVVVINKAPHPNAAKIYLDWLLSRDGQTVTSRAANTASRRLDVPTSHLDPMVVPKPGVDYQPAYRQEFIEMRDEVTAFLKAILPD